MTKYSKEFFGVPEDQPFNLPAAIDAYEYVMTNDDYEFAISKALFDYTTLDFINHEEEIERVTNAYISKRFEDAKRGLTRTLISKGRNGEDTDSTAHVVEVLDLISKAGEYTSFERAANAGKQTRGEGGRWVNMNKPVRQTLKTPLSRATADSMGIAPLSRRLPRDRKVAYQNDYMKVVQGIQDAMNTYGDQDPNVRVRVRYSDGKTSGAYSLSDALQEALDGSDQTGMVMSRNYAGQKARTVSDLVIESKGGNMPFDTLAASPGISDWLGRIPADASFDPNSASSTWRTRGGVEVEGSRETTPGAWGQFREGTRTPVDWDDNGQVRSNESMDMRTNEQMWRRMSAGAQLGGAIAGAAGVDDPRLYAALGAANWAGQFAPEAEKVVGPHARRAAYRYRGVEKTPSNIYQDSINQLRQKYPTGRKAHDVMIEGEDVSVPINVRNPTAGMRKVYKESPVIGYMKTILPDPQRYTLNRKSGTIPPSQGIIIDRSGKVVTEAVGYGEDWYVPFNLKNLSKLKGGEYIRTRAFGGLTTEDIYVGLVGGARAVTVVSNSGVFTIEFDDSFRGSRRYNEKAGRMHARYAQLLDAVKSKDVTLGSIPKERREELQLQAAGKWDPDEPEEEKRYKAEFQRLLNKEQENPKLAAATKEAVKRDVLNQYIAENVATTSNPAADFEEYIAQQTAKAAREGNLAEIQGKFSTLDRALDTFGLTATAKREIDLEQARYEADLNPLQLNAQGYNMAGKALQDQFPYYIKSVKHVPFQENAMGSDHGYVKPKFIRPEGALAGFYDPTIQGIGSNPKKGGGKFTADQTNYQNYSVMGTRPLVTEEAKMNRKLNASRESESEAVGSASTNTPAANTPAAAGPAAVNPNDPYARQMSVDATMALVAGLRRSRRWSPRFPDNNTNFAGSEMSNKQFNDLSNEAEYNMVLGMDESELRSRLMASDGSDRGNLERQLQAVKNVLDVDEELWRNYRQGGMDVAQRRPENTMEILTNIGGKTYDYPGFQPGKNAAYYNAKIDEMLRSSVAAQSLDITPESSAAEVTKKAKEKAALLMDQQRAIDARRHGYRSDVMVSASPSEVKRNADDLAKITQAFIQRDKAMKRDATYERINAGEMAEPPKAEETPEAKPEQEKPVNPVERVAALRDEIHSMVGMNKVANEVDGLVASAVQAKRREEAGLPVGNRSMHLVFTGDPGTGKTTIAEKLAPIYNQLGLIPSDKVVKKSRADLVGGYQGQTAMKTQKAFDEAKGGVLFIDEAYALKQGDDDSYGQEAIDTLLANVENSRSDTVVILAGYPQEMDKFLAANPGMKSRFPKTINFKNYTATDMKKIAGYMMDHGGYATTPGVRALINNAVTQIAVTPNHANARDVRNFYESIADAQDRRLSKVTNPSVEQLQEITAKDVRAGMDARGMTLPRSKKAA